MGIIRHIYFGRYTHNRRYIHNSKVRKKLINNLNPNKEIRIKSMKEYSK